MRLTTDLLLFFAIDTPAVFYLTMQFTDIIPFSCVKSTDTVTDIDVNEIFVYNHKEFTGSFTADIADVSKWS